MRISSMSDYDMDNYINTALDCGYNYFRMMDFVRQNPMLVKRVDKSKFVD